MERLEDEEEKLIPRFVFDASEPCRYVSAVLSNEMSSRIHGSYFSVTVFYMAQEDAAKKSKLVSIMQEPGPRSMYTKGVRMSSRFHGCD